MSYSRPFFKDQVFEELKTECLRTGKLFTDNRFPPCDTSIDIEYSCKREKVKWIRAKDLSSNPQFIVNGISKDDLDQGVIGDCWLICSMATIAEKSEYRQKVVPDDQSFGNDYCGLFHFRFWYKGAWVDVVVDDYLPYDEETKELLFLNNKKTKNKFWGQLLEKAYAKMYSCYRVLNDGGIPEDSMIDLTGGVAEVFDIEKLIQKQTNSEYSKANSDIIWKLIVKSLKMGSVVGVGIRGKDKAGKEYLEKLGLADRHAYAITGVETEKFNLIRVKNPYGMHTTYEWSGDWGKKSNKWNSVDAETKKRLDFGKLADGEFWMPYDEFVKKFDRLSLVHINLNAFTGQQRSASSWDFRQVFNSFKKEDKDNQHVINLIDSDNKKNRSIIVALMTLDYLEKRKKGEFSFPLLGINLYKVHDPNARLKGKYSLSELKQIGTNQSELGSREVTKRFHVEPGVYVIIPTTDAKTKTGYLLRVYSESVNNNNEESFVNLYEGNKEVKTAQKPTVNVNPYRPDPSFNPYGPSSYHYSYGFGNSNANSNRNIFQSKSSLYFNLLNKKIATTSNKTNEVENISNGRQCQVCLYCSCCDCRNSYACEDSDFENIDEKLNKAIEIN